MHTGRGASDMEGEGSKERLNAYIHDFLMKSAMHRSAQVFFEEAGLRENTNTNGSAKERRDIISTSRSYLYEWWQIFWELCAVRDNRNAEPAVQAFYKTWSEKNNQQSDLMTQEIQAAVKQQLSEDAGNYGDEGVDASELALVVGSIPLHSNLREMPSRSSNGIIKQKKKRRKKLGGEFLDRPCQDSSLLSGTCGASKNLMPHRVVANASSSHSQELPTSFELQNFDTDCSMFNGAGTLPGALPLDFPPITGEEPSFLDNNTGRTFNFLDGV